MRSIFAVLITFAVLMTSGCERKYAILTEQGIVEMPLSKALKTATSTSQLYPILSDAATMEDRAKIEKRIEEIQGTKIPDEQRNYSFRDDYVNEQTQRRLKYVKSHFLDERTKQIIISGGYIEGMTKEEFIASRGEPVDTKKVKTEQGEAEVLYEGLFDTKKFYFLDGKLSYWE